MVTERGAEVAAGWSARCTPSGRSCDYHLTLAAMSDPAGVGLVANLLRGRICTHMVVKQSTLSIAAGAIFLVLAALLGGGVFLISSSINQQQRAVERQAESRQLGVDLMNAANLMSDAARKFVLTADPANFTAYWKEVNETKTRERVASRLSELDTPQEELDLLADS